MIKVSVLYPNKPGSRFDMAYYVNTHMPLAMRLLAKGLRKTEVDAGLQGVRPGEPPPFSEVVSSTSIPSTPSSRLGHRPRPSSPRTFPAIPTWRP